ncbi:MAG: hypothetical protein AAF585_26555 [Verrucomicrobiota bacterium]
MMGFRITMEAEHGHQLVTGAVLFSLTSIGMNTNDPLVAEIQQLLMRLQKEDGRWGEGGRIFDDGAEIENVDYNNWAHRHDHRCPGANDQASRGRRTTIFSGSE